MFASRMRLFNPPRPCRILMHTRSLSVRRATINDVPAIGALMKESYADTYKHGYFTPPILEEMFGRNFIENILPREIAENKNIFLVGTEGSKLVAYAKVLLLHYQKEAHLDKLYLLNAYQNKGIGSQLLLQCFEEALKRGYLKMTLQVYEKNLKAIEFYKKNGFHTNNKKIQYALPRGQLTTEFNLEMECSDISHMKLHKLSPRPK